MKPNEIQAIDPAKVRVLIHRDRARSAHEMIADDVSENGQQQPGKVIDIRDQPAETRKRPGGGTYDYLLVYGEGRLEIAKRLRRPFLARVAKESEAEALAQHAIENANRKPLSGMQTALLVKASLDSGESIDSIAKRHHVTPEHVRKWVRILDHTAPGLEDDVAEMSINDAEALTSLPPREQSLVVAEFRDTKPATIRAIAKKAKEIVASGQPLSRTALRKSLEHDAEQVAVVESRLRDLERDFGRGPQTIATLLEKPGVPALLRKHGVPTERFEKLYAEA